jgi:hypothetical protein
VAHAQKWDSVNLDPLVYVHFTYRDLLDRLREDYFQVPMIGAGWRMSDSDGNEVFRRWRDPRGLVELSDLSAGRLLLEATKRIERKEN